ncbi:MAG: energy transducer TonB [Verrucomicrobia bacterium]|nr:energy transducer TonB [Verrucomicrobiota bacterium]
MKTFPKIVAIFSLFFGTVFSSAEGTWDAPEKIYSFDELDSVPVPLTELEPKYPYGLKKMGKGGKVILQFAVDEEGNVLNPKVIESSRASLLTSSIKALYAWTFSPGRKDGQPVKTGLQVAVDFLGRETAFNLVSASDYVLFPIPKRREAVELDALNKWPESIKRVQPKYDAGLKKRGVEGTVVVWFVIDEQGKVINPQVAESSHPSFAAASLEAVLLWEFSPGLLEGKPTKSLVSLTLSFTLRKKHKRVYPQ